MEIIILLVFYSEYEKRAGIRAREEELFARYICAQ
jgi:hypothetical protein